MPRVLSLCEPITARRGKGMAIFYPWNSYSKLIWRDFELWGSEREKLCWSRINFVFIKIKRVTIKTVLFWAIEKKIKCQIRTSFPQMIRSNSLPLDYENMADSFFKGVLPFLVVSASWTRYYKLYTSACRWQHLSWLVAFDWRDFFIKLKQITFHLG